MRDETLSRGYLTLHIDGNSDIAAARAAAQSIYSELLAVSDCEITGIDIIYRTYIEEGLTGDDAEKDSNFAAFVFTTDVENQYGVVILPAINELLILETNEIDTTNSDVAAFVAALISGPWVTPFNYDLIMLEATLYNIQP